MTRIGKIDERNTSAVQATTKALFHTLANARGFGELNDIQRAGIYLLCDELSNVCHGVSPHKFQNLAYVLGVTDSDDIKRILMEALNEIS